VIAPSCTCCRSGQPLVPVARDNAERLSAIAFRVGTFAAFRHSILHDFARVPELAGLRSRSDDDFTITLVDLWATVADVITFYAERIANETFIGTATQRDSVLRLVRLLDYELGGGAAATTLLAFTLEKDARLAIPVGTRVQSIPVATQKPQIFETRSPIKADARINALRVTAPPRAIIPLGAGRRSEIVAPGADSAWAAANLSAGDSLVAVTPTVVANLTLEAVAINDDEVSVTWTQPAPRDIESASLYRAGRTFRLHGADAPAKAISATVNAAGQTTFAEVNIDHTLAAGAQVSLDAVYPNMGPGALLLLIGSKAGVTGTQIVRIAAARQARMQLSGSPVAATVTQLDLEDPTGPIAAVDVTDVATNVEDLLIRELLGGPIGLWAYEYPERLNGPAMLIGGRRVGPRTIEVGRQIVGKPKPGAPVDPALFESGRRVLLADGPGLPVSAAVVGSGLFGSGMRFGPTMSDPAFVRNLGLGAGQVQVLPVLLSGAPTPPSRSSAEILVTMGDGPPVVVQLRGLPSGRLNRISWFTSVRRAIQTSLRAAAPASPTFANARVGLLDQRFVIIPGSPGDGVTVAGTAVDPTTADELGFGPGESTWLDASLSGPILSTAALGGELVVEVGLQPERTVQIPGSSIADVLGDLISGIGRAILTRVDDRVLIIPPVPARPERSFIAVTLKPDEPVDLDGSSARLFGNVAPASHGETVRDEIVGDGNAAKAFQKFPLRKKPLTKGPLAGSGGSSSSLEVLVDGVLWSEVPTLYDAGANAEVYRTRLADDGTTTVEFGDGRMGRRLPTGQANVVARYRTGLGSAGRVGAGAIATLLDRPTGLKSARNLLPSDGGADPQTLAAARDAAPRTVLTFDRIVSLQDAEALATETGEIERASAGWVWRGDRRVIHLTVAGPGGAPLSAAGLKLVAARLDTKRDPNYGLLIDNVRRLAIKVSIQVEVDPRYVQADVVAAVRASVGAGLSFEGLSFGQTVAVSDVYALVHAVAGVRSAIVQSLDLKTSDALVRAAHGLGPGPGERIRIRPASASRTAPGDVEAAEQAWLELPAQDLRLAATGGLAGGA
jgi:hypothetical protein